MVCPRQPAAVEKRTPAVRRIFFEFSGKYPKLPDLPDFLPEMPEYFVTVSPKICPNFEKNGLLPEPEPEPEFCPNF